MTHFLPLRRLFCADAVRYIAEMLEQVEARTGAYVVPHDPPKYFRYHPSRDDPSFVLVDIHVTRGADEICVKQDLSVPLLPGTRSCLDILTAEQATSRQRRTFICRPVFAFTALF